MYATKGEDWRIGHYISDSCWFPRFSTLLNDRIYMADSIKSNYVLGTSTIPLQSATISTGPAVSWTGCVQRRHNNSANCAFPDGHVKSLSEEALKATVPESTNEVYSVASP